MELMEIPTLDKLKEYKIYLTDEEKEALVDVHVDCSTFEDSVLAGIINQIFNCYEEVGNWKKKTRHGDLGKLQDKCYLHWRMLRCKRKKENPLPCCDNCWRIEREWQSRLKYWLGYFARIVTIMTQNDMRFRIFKPTKLKSRQLTIISILWKWHSTALIVRNRNANIETKNPLWILRQTNHIMIAA